MDMKPVKTEFGVATWFDGIGESVQEEIEGVFSASPPSADFPIVWAPEDNGIGGPAVEDPLTIHVSLPLGDPNDDDGFTVVYQTTVGELVDHLIRVSVAYRESVITGDKEKSVARSVVAALRKEADRLEEAIAE